MDYNNFNMEYAEIKVEILIRNFKEYINSYLKLETNEKVKPILCICFTVVMLIIFLGNFFERKRKINSVKKSLYKVLPRIQWTPFNLPVIDGLITLVKLGIDGVRVRFEPQTKLGLSFTFSLHTHRIIATSDPIIIKKVLSSTDPGHLNKPPFIYKLLFSNQLKDSLMVADFHTWSLHRKVISRAFNYNSFPQFLKIMNEEGKCLAKSACDLAEIRNGSIDNKQFNNLMEHNTVKIIAKIMIGSDSTHIPDTEWDHLQATLLRAKEITCDRLFNPLLLFPPFWAISKRKEELDQLLNFTREFVTKVISNYKMKGVRGEILEDDNGSPVYEDVNSQINLTDAVSESVVEHMIRAGLSDKAIQDEIFLFMAVGQDSICTTMNFLLFHLASNVAIQKKCEDEISRMMNAHGYTAEGGFSLEHLSELKYLERCILEGLRISPPAPVFMRRMDKELDIDEEYLIEAGHCVVIDPWLAHRNPEIFPNPETFDPDRFLPENVKKRHSHSFIPFSMGIRNCIGWKVALLELKVLTSWILRYFDMTTNDGPFDVKVLFGITLTPERPFDVKFKLRK